MAGDPDYTRKWSICRTFAASGACSWALCKYNHSLIDTTRIAALVGDVTNASFASSSTPLPAAAATAEQTFFLLEYTKYSLQSDSSLNADTGPTPWRMRLMGGGRAMLVSQGGTMSVQPAYPAKGQGQGAGVALVELEKRVFGCCATVSSSTRACSAGCVGECILPIDYVTQPDLTRPSLCRAFSDGACKWGASCRFSHSLFSTDRIERLLERAVEEGGYKDFKPICEVEYVGRRDSTRPLSPVWRVTVRCVLGYHQKTAPQPIVVTSDNLNTAMRLLEGQFTRGSGKAPPPQGQAGPAGGSHRTRSKRPRAHTSVCGQMLLVNNGFK